MKTGMRLDRAHGVAPPIALGLLLATGAFSMVRAGSDAPARIRPGAIEVGLAGTLSAVEGTVRSTLELRAGSFLGTLGGIGGAEVGLGYSHVSSLDLVNLTAAVSWQRAVGETAIYPYLALAGGLRQERIGSFEQARYPVGLDLGVRALAGPRAGLRLEYRYRRVLSDPVADYDEHDILAGLSLFFRNRPSRAGP